MASFTYVHRIGLASGDNIAGARREHQSAMNFFFLYMYKYIWTNIEVPYIVEQMRAGLDKMAANEMLKRFSASFFVVVDGAGGELLFY